MILHAQSFKTKSIKTRHYPWVKKRSYPRTNTIMSALSFMTPSHNMIIFFSSRHRFRHLICIILYNHYSWTSIKHITLLMPAAYEKHSRLCCSWNICFNSSCTEAISILHGNAGQIAHNGAPQTHTPLNVIGVTSLSSFLRFTRVNNKCNHN